MDIGHFIGLAAGVLILTPLLNRLLGKPIGRLLAKHGYDLNGKKIGQNFKKELDANVLSEYMPRVGDIFKGKINDLCQSDSKGWRRRDISFFKHEVNYGRRFGYPSCRDQIILIDSTGVRYGLNFSQPETDERVCLGTPSRLKPWYQQKGFNDHSVNLDETIFFEYVGQGMEFYVFTKDEYISRKGGAAH